MLENISCEKLWQNVVQRSQRTIKSIKTTFQNGKFSCSIKILPCSERGTYRHAPPFGTSLFKFCTMVIQTLQISTPFFFFLVKLRLIHWNIVLTNVYLQIKAFFLKKKPTNTERNSELKGHVQLEHKNWIFFLHRLQYYKTVSVKIFANLKGKKNSDLSFSKIKDGSKFLSTLVRPIIKKTMF